MDKTKKPRLRLPRRVSLKPLSVKLYEDQEPKLREIARREGVSVLDVIRASADMAIEAEQEKRK